MIAVTAFDPQSDGGANKRPEGEPAPMARANESEVQTSTTHRSTAHIVNGAITIPPRSSSRQGSAEWQRPLPPACLRLIFTLAKPGGVLCLGLITILNLGCANLLACAHVQPEFCGSERFPNRKPNDFVFPFEQYGGKGRDEALGSSAARLMRLTPLSPLVIAKRVGRPPRGERA
jgi:hypothetical protein